MTLKDIKKDFDYNGYDNGRSLFTDIEEIIERAFKTGLNMGSYYDREWGGDHEKGWQQNKSKFLGE